MIKNFFNILYIFILTLFVFIILIFILNNNIFLDYKIIYLVFFLIFPFFDKLINYIKKDFTLSKIFYIIALFLIINTLLFLGIGDKKISETSSIYAYYFLIIGVLIEIFNSIFNIKINFKEFIKKYFLKFNNYCITKIINYKNKVLEEIGELKNNDISKKKSLFTKLCKYYYIKLKYNIVNTVYLFYGFIGILILFSFIFDTSYLLNLTIFLFLFLYTFSKYLNIDYNYFDNNYKNLINNNYFINKAILYSSLGLIFGDYILRYLKVGNNNYVSFSIFLLFFIVFYLLFYNIEKRKLFKDKITKIKDFKNINKKENNDKVFKFNLIEYLRKHIYLFLNIITIFTILIFLGFKNDFFVTNYENNEVKNDNNKKIQIEKKKIKKTKLTENQKNKLINEIKTNLISDEIDINNTIENIGENIILDNNIEKISVKDYYNFNKLLTIGSKNNDVLKLEEIMGKLGYFKGIPDKIFDNETKKSLTKLLKKECLWPETTKGIFGNQAKQCLYSLKIKK